MFELLLDRYVEVYSRISVEEKLNHFLIRKCSTFDKLASSCAPASSVLLIHVSEL
jgi:hypothetical protein